MSDEDRINQSVVIRLKKLNELGSTLPNIGDYPDGEMANEKLAMAEVITQVRNAAFKEAAELMKEEFQNIRARIKQKNPDDNVNILAQQGATFASAHKSILSLIEEEGE